MSAGGFTIAGPQSSLAKFMEGRVVVAAEARKDSTQWCTEFGVSEAVYNDWNALIRRVLAVGGEQP